MSLTVLRLTTGCEAAGRKPCRLLASKRETAKPLTRPTQFVRAGIPAPAACHATICSSMDRKKVKEGRNRDTHLRSQFPRTRCQDIPTNRRAYSDVTKRSPVERGPVTDWPPRLARIL